ncbi:hypothetical protein FRC06_000972 [Ceratobasidium sp. 370]|nr:hypothetical protein FRC06_000972 [Ceratobasidium sp. 370]
MVSEFLDGCWRGCYEPDDDDEGQPFAADAIISNPPAFAHIHCAEALGIPLQLSFTMPWCATAEFPHPLVNILQSNAEKGLTNVLSYALAELMTWQGLGDVINNFRTSTLGLKPLSFRSGPGVTDRLRVPWTYCMSPALVPKPDDWTNHIDVVGFYFLDLASDYQPPDNLKNFLSGGEAPVYIGFGSIVIDKPQEMTQEIFKAIKASGTRAILSAGWGGLFAPDSPNVPDGVLILDKETGNVPHDWLFNHVSAVSAGLKAGKPTIVVPFFGDQPFWGAMIAKAGAGPEPIPQKELTAERLIEALKFVKSPRAQRAAQKMGEQIRSEDGVALGVDSFHRHLPLLNMRCDVDPSRLAEWWSPEHCLRFSGFVAATLIDAKLIDMKRLQPHRTKEYDTHKQATDPITGGSIEIMRTVTHYYAGIAQIFYSPLKGIINTTTAIPRGVMSIIGGVSEGFHNVPSLYGSDVRQTGPVDDIGSGFREGAKGLFYGYYDGITGLVKEPLAASTDEERRVVIDTFKRLTQKGVTAERKKTMEAEAREALKTDKNKKLTLSDKNQNDEVEASSNMDTPPRRASPEPVDHRPAPDSKQPDKPPLPPRSTPQHNQDDEDAAFQRDLDMALQLSLAEQSGYERGLRHGST